MNRLTRSILTTAAAIVVAAPTAAQLPPPPPNAALPSMPTARSPGKHINRVIDLWIKG